MLQQSSCTIDDDAQNELLYVAAKHSGTASLTILTLRV